MSEKPKRYKFQTEARQLLDLMIHSVYSNKDIFLRELISNSSDALDKRRFAAVQEPELLPEGTELGILIETDSEQRTLSVSDNGIGMNQDEVKALIGTIAKSGSREFLQQLKEARNGELAPELIGQFGVGFYSTFMVADKVTLITRRVGEETATKWESSGDGTYTLEGTERPEPGTTVTLHLKPVDTEDGLHDYTEHWTLERIVKQYSDFVAYPIRMDLSRTEHERDAEGKIIEGSEPREVTERRTLNSMKAIWLRDRDSVTDEEYNEFYKHIAHDWTEPLMRIQAKIEGTLEYRLLLYVPGHAPMDLFFRDGKHGVHLYVKRVFIMDDCRELLPDYLRFIRGVVDSEDLSLNISREMLQQNRQIQRMRKGIVNKILAELKELREKDAETYDRFWEAFGRVLKEGLFEDVENRDALFDLVRFKTTHDPRQESTLQEYIERMAPDQNAIYYLTGASRERIEASPHLEAFRAKNYEVLLLDDPVDEIWTQGVFEYKGKTLQSAAKGALDLGSEEERKQAEETRKEQAARHQSLLECLRQKLDAHVKEVRLSDRLTESAACLVGDAEDLTPQMAQLLRAMGQEVPVNKRILELNPAHPILEKLQAAYDANADSPVIAEYADLLYGQALLAEGGALPDPGRFSKLVAGLMVKSL